MEPNGSSPSDNSPPGVQILSQKNVVHYLSFYFFKVNNILHVLGLPSVLFPLMFSNQNHLCISHFPHTRHMSRRSHHPWFHHSSNIWCGLQIMKILIMQLSPVSGYFFPLYIMSDLEINYSQNTEKCDTCCTMQCDLVAIRLCQDDVITYRSAVA